MSEAELIFTALAELSTRQIAESVEATGMAENTEAGKKGGEIAKNARLALEQKTGRRVVTGENFLPPAQPKKKISLWPPFQKQRTLSRRPGAAIRRNENPLDHAKVGAGRTALLASLDSGSRSMGYACESRRQP